MMLPSLHPGAQPIARKTYSEQFKRDAVKLMTEKGYSLSKASEALGVSQTTLSTW